MKHLGVAVGLLHVWAESLGWGGVVEDLLKVVALGCLVLHRQVHGADAGVDAVSRDLGVWPRF